MSPSQAPSLSTALAFAFAALLSFLLAFHTVQASELRGTQTPATAQDPAATNPLRGTVLGFAVPKLSAADRLATLEAVQLVLTEVGDGASYLWHRRHGRLSGLIKAERSFRNAAGTICRRLRVTLMSGPKSRSIRATACRSDDGRWSFDG
ncbi:MAG: hypothetical protein AAFV26_04090 [Pseudomonadota bacterium]